MVHIVFMNMAQTGHMNPTLPVVAELRKRGCAVSYFVQDTMRDVVEAAGATWYPFRYPNSDFTGNLGRLDEDGIAELVPEGTPAEEIESFPNCLVYCARQMLPALLEDLRALSPPLSAVVYEPFLAAAPVAAHVLGVPAISLFTMMGPGVMAQASAMAADMEAKPWVQKPRQHIMKRYGFDVFARGCLMEWYSPCDNIVSTVDELFVPPQGSLQKQRFGDFPFRCVGVLIDSKIKRVIHARATPQMEAAMSGGAGEGMDNELDLPLPLERLDAARAEGRPVLFVSLGTVATGDLWKQPLGIFANGNDELPHDEPGLATYSGRDFCQRVWRTCFDAFGADIAPEERADPLVVMTLGPEEDALEGMPPTPNNFILRRTVPQLEVLRRCNAFVSHGGANSMHESLSSGVPLAVVPIFADQPSNADAVARTGAGVSFRHPLSTLTSASLRRAVVKMLDDADDNAYRIAAWEMATKIKAGGGVAAAADTILKHARVVAVAAGGA